MFTTRRRTPRRRKIGSSQDAPLVHENPGSRESLLKEGDQAHDRFVFSPDDEDEVHDAHQDVDGVEKIKS